MPEVEAKGRWPHGSDDVGFGFWAEENPIEQVSAKARMRWSEIRKKVYLSWNAHQLELPMEQVHWLELASTQRSINATDIRPRNYLGDADWTGVITCDWGTRGGCRNLVLSLILSTQSSNCWKSERSKQTNSIWFSRQYRRWNAHLILQACDTRLVSEKRFSFLIWVVYASAGYMHL